MSARSIGISSISVARPVTFARKALVFSPDPAQTIVLESNPHRCILHCTRHGGKSAITAIKALHRALMPRSLTIVISPSGRQSSEFLRKISTFLPALGMNPRSDGDNEISLHLPNSSSTVRGYSSVSLLLIDEASRVPEEFLTEERAEKFRRQKDSLPYLSPQNIEEEYLGDSSERQSSTSINLEIKQANQPLNPEGRPC